MIEVARPDEHGEAMRREVLRDLKAESPIGPGDEGDALVVHRSSSGFWRVDQ
jgi:hypothetical protein